MARDRTYFGEPDASVAVGEDLAAQHVLRDIERDLRWNMRTSGTQVVVGVKGSGKTELRRYLESCSSAFTFNLDGEKSYFSQDVSSVPRQSSRIRNAVAAVLLREFARQFGESSTSRAAQALKIAFKASTTLLKNIPGAIDLQAPGVRVRVGDLIKSASDSTSSAVLQDAVDELVTMVVDALSKNDTSGAILIDDVEEVFLGIEKNPLFLEGIVKAVAEINRRGLGKIHALLFVKHGLWRVWFEDHKDYDKVDSLIDFLAWDHQALVELITKRIAHQHGMERESRSIEDLWGAEFSWNGELDNITRYCTRYCVSGPRDMIRLCNLAGVNAGDELITQANIEAILGRYSEQKIFGLQADFGDTYPGISRFVVQVFQGAPAQMATGMDVAKLINLRTFLDLRFNDQFKEQQWYNVATKEELAAVMYQVGVIGFESPHGPIYAIEEPNLSNAEFLGKKGVCIHPAFHPYLGIN